MQIDYKQFKACATSFIDKEMHIKTKNPKRCPFPPIKLLKRIKKLDNKITLMRTWGKYFHLLLVRVQINTY